MPNLHFKCGTLQKMPYVNIGVHRVMTVKGNIIQLHKNECCGIETQRIFENFLMLLNSGLLLQQIRRPPRQVKAVTVEKAVEV